MKRAFAKRIAFAVLAAVVLFCTPNTVLAYPDREQHNKELEQVLFDDPFFSRTHKNDAQGQAVTALETAAYLCIDQFGQSGSKDLEALGRYGVVGLPKEVAAINPENYNLAPNTHRSYSHRGWEVAHYPTKENQARFEIRKRILLDTANVALSNGIWHKWSRSYTTQCDSFCALIYYTHILGDYLEDIESEDFKKFNGQGNGIKMAFARGNASESNPDLFWEIKKHLAILFADQSSSLTYKQLMIDLDNLAIRSRRILGTKNGVDNYEDYEAIKDCVNELMAILCGEYGDYHYANRVHALLVNEEFFTNAFPSA